MSLHNLIALLGLSIATLTSFFGIVAWLVNNAKRRYGLERDFAHIKRNYEQINSHLSVIITENDRRFDALDKALIEIESKINK